MYKKIEVEQQIESFQVILTVKVMDSLEISVIRVNSLKCFVSSRYLSAHISTLQMIFIKFGFF